MTGLSSTTTMRDLRGRGSSWDTFIALRCVRFLIVGGLKHCRIFQVHDKRSHERICRGCERHHLRMVAGFGRGFQCEGADEICVTACGFGGTCQPRSDVRCEPGPVCDCSGEVTYSSNCAAYEAGAGVSRDGACPSTP